MSRIDKLHRGGHQLQHKPPGCILLWIIFADALLTLAPRYLFVQLGCSMTSQPTTQYSISAVSRLTGKSRSTIQRDLKAGKLSYVDGPNGAKLIDGVEIARVYEIEPDALKREEGGLAAQSADGTAQQHSELQRRIDTLEGERRREREQLQSQIDHLQDVLKLAQDGSNKAMRLLEHRSESRGPDDLMRSIEAKLNQQQTELSRQVESLRSEAKQQAEDELKGLPWWSVLRRLASSSSS